MRHRIASIALLSACIAAPLGAMAQTVGVGTPLISVGEARDIAVMNGVLYIRKLESDDGKWKVQGRDQAGHRVEMEIDPRSGEIAHLERFD
jgi:Peptidase propeptide and YPEB domain